MSDDNVVPFVKKNKTKSIGQIDGGEDFFEASGNGELQVISCSSAMIELDIDLIPMTLIQLYVGSAIVHRMDVQDRIFIQWVKFFKTQDINFESCLAIYQKLKELADVEESRIEKRSYFELLNSTLVFLINSSRNPVHIDVIKDMNPDQAALRRIERKINSLS